jgi:hypothetical protein
MQHLRAFLWLRWRLRVNQVRKAGTLNAVLLAILAGAGAILAVVLFVVGLLVGVFVLREVDPLVLLFVWDGLVVAFLFSWCVGLLTELQRSEGLSLDRFLHLPVSLSGVFLINYLSSLFSFNLIVFVPAMLGLWLGLLSRGPAMLLLLPLLVAFFLAVTALTYQFQGWLASLMTNQRRRRTIIVVLTMVFVILCQAPQLINIYRPWEKYQKEEQARYNEEVTALANSLKAGKITLPEYNRRLKELHQKRNDQSNERKHNAWVQAQQVGTLINMVVPPGWLPLGAMSLAEGNVVVALLGTLGLALVGAASLWRAYRTTVRLYTGQFTSGKAKAVVAAPPPKRDRTAIDLLERRLPFLSEQAAAIALASFRSLLRAPEAKMMLLTPVLLAVIFGGLLLSARGEMPQGVPSLVAFGAIAMMLFSSVQFLGNQFGFDRAGFRVFVLCPAPRRDILLGKNLAFAPVVLGLVVPMIILLQFFYPMRIDHFLANLPVMVSMYLVYCLLANCLSILAPMPIAAGSLKPTNVKAVPILLQMVFLFFFPLALSPMLFPLGLELALDALGWVKGVPIHLLLSLVVCVAVVFLYRFVLGWQGRWLLAREQAILDVVAGRAE